MAAQVILQLCAIFVFTIGADAWRCAKYDHYFSQQPDYIDCIWDCCGNSFNRHCCAPIGIIVGCSIVGAVIVAALVVIMICWWQRRKAQYQKGPKLFHNRRHSHHPVAPTSVTRPAPYVPYSNAPSQLAGYPPDDYSKPPATGYRPPPPGGYRGPQQDYRSPPPGGYRGPPQDYRPPPPGGYRGPPQDVRHSPAPPYREKPPLDSSLESDRESGYKRGPPSDRGEKTSHNEFFM